MPVAAFRATVNDSNSQCSVIIYQMGVKTDSICLSIKSQLVNLFDNTQENCCTVHLLANVLVHVVGSFAHTTVVAFCLNHSPVLLNTQQI